MSINWIATNPKQNVKNQANQASMPDSEFTQLMRIIIHVIFTFFFYNPKPTELINSLIDFRTEITMKKS